MSLISRFFWLVHQESIKWRIIPIEAGGLLGHSSFHAITGRRLELTSFETGQLSLKFNAKAVKNQTYLKCK